MCGSRAVCCFFKQKTAYEMRISDWSSDVCSFDLRVRPWSRNPRTVRSSSPRRPRWHRADWAYRVGFVCDEGAWVLAGEGGGLLQGNHAGLRSSQSVASGGKVKESEWVRPCHGTGSAWTPSSFPTPLPA